MTRTSDDGLRCRLTTIVRAGLVTVCAGALAVACSSTGSGAAVSAESGAASNASGSTNSGSATNASASIESATNGSAASGSAATGSESGSDDAAASSGSGDQSASSGGGAAAVLPSSCKAVLAVVVRDLGADLAYADTTTDEATELDCNLYESSEAKDNGAGYVSMTWAVMDSADLASLTFGTTASMTFGDEKAQPVSGLGDKAVALTSDGAVAQLNVLSGAALLSVGQVQYDTPIALAKWTALAKDLLSGSA